MKKLLVLLLALSGQIAYAQKANVVSGDFLENGPVMRNYVINPSARVNEFNKTTSNATLTRDTDSGDAIDGAASWLCDASAQNGYCEWTLKTVHAPDTSGNCLFAIYQKGDGSLYKMQILDGSSNVLVASTTIPNTSDYGWRLLNYQCGASGERKIRVTQTEAGTAPAINIGRVFYGAAWNFSVAPASIPTTSYTPTGSLSTNVTHTGRYWLSNDRLYGSGEINFSGANTQSGGTVNLPSGFTIDTSKVSSSPTSIVGKAIIYDSSTDQMYDASVRYATTTSVRITRGDTTAGSQVDPSNNRPITFASGDFISWYFDVPVTGFGSNTYFTPAQVGWRVDANISGANPSLGTSAQSSYIGIENGTLTLTNNSGPNVIAAQIPCSSTNAPSGTTCSAGNESVGVSWPLPVAGDVLACVTFTHYLLITNGAQEATFQIVETASNAQTVLQEGRSRSLSRSAFAGTSEDSSYPHRVCGTFTFSSATQRTLRLMYSQPSSSGTVTSNLILADANVSTGRKDIHWEVYPISQAWPMPVITGGVVGSTTVLSGFDTGPTSIYSGTYTPTLTNGTNISASTADVCSYLRIGQIVNVTCRATLTCTTASGTASVFNASLPIASNFSAVSDGSGVFGSNAATTAEVGTVGADATNDNMVVNFNCQSTTSLVARRFTFQYQIK